MQQKAERDRIKKEAKEKAAAEAQTENPPPQPTDKSGTFVCKKCKARFATKNKLFNHLKSTGHAVFK